VATGGFEAGSAGNLSFVPLQPFGRIRFKASMGQPTRDSEQTVFWGSFNFDDALFDRSVDEHSGLEGCG
jgi:hypothetical protein